MWDHTPLFYRVYLHRIHPVYLGFTSHIKMPLTKQGLQIYSMQHSVRSSSYPWLQCSCLFCLVDFMPFSVCNSHFFPVCFVYYFQVDFKVYKIIYDCTKIIMSVWNMMESSRRGSADEGFMSTEILAMYRYLCSYLYWTCGRMCRRRGTASWLSICQFEVLASATNLKYILFYWQMYFFFNFRLHVLIVTYRVMTNYCPLPLCSLTAN